MIVGHSPTKLPRFSGPPDQYLSTAQFRSADLVSSQLINAGESMPMARWRSSLGRDAVTRNFSHHTIILQNAGEDVRRIDSPAYLNRRSRPGSLLILPAGMKAAWRSDKVSDRTHFYVHPDLLQQVSLEVLGKECSIRDDGIFIFDHKFAELLKRYSFAVDAAGSSRFERDMLMLEIMTFMVRRYSAHPAGAMEQDPKDGAALCAFIEDNLSSKIRAQEISEALGLSAAALKKLARVQLGMPLHRYVVERRLDHAERLIKSGIPIAQAALDAGFSSQSHLTSCMSEKRNITPAALTPTIS